MPKRDRIPWARVLVLTLLLARPARSAAAPVMELYGTFESMGVIVSITQGEDADQDGAAVPWYRVAGSGDAYRQGFPLSRVSAGRFVGSLFRLSPGTAYDVRVVLSDPDGGPLAGATVSGAASTRAEITLPAPSRSYHVSPGGTGTACTRVSPCALKTALGQVEAGEEVLLRGGAYYQGELSLTHSGAAGAPVVIRSYPGETAVLDGADPATFAWTKDGEAYRATVNAGGPHLVMADGQRLYPYQTRDDLQNDPWGLPGFFASGTTVYVRLAAGVDPNAPGTMLVSRFNNAFTVTQNHVVFQDLVFRHYGLGSYAKALYFDGASDNLVQGCTFAVNDLGIGLKRDSHRNVFQEDEFYDTDFGWPWKGVKAGSGLETGGIRMYSPMTGRGTVIRRNTFHDYFDGFGACPDEAAGEADETSETDVYENLVYDAGDDGMETDGQCSNVRIWRNTFHDVLVGISLAPVYTGPVYAFRNLIYRTGAGNSEYDGNSFKFNSGYDPSGAIYLFHNTADAAHPGGPGLALMSPGSWKLIHSRNNVWSGAGYALYDANPGEPLDLDRDDLYTTQAGELAWWDGRHLATVAELSSATGQEPHGLAVEPGFLAPASGDYTLGPGSQLVDQGTLIPGVDDDFEGFAPDIGAFESSLSAAVQGLCGNASGGAYASAPSTDLCAAGMPTALAGAGPWSWSCLGASGGADAECGASLRAADGPGGGTARGGGGCATGGCPLSLAALLAIALRRRRGLAAR